MVSGIGEMYQYYRPKSSAGYYTGPSFSDIILSPEDQQSISASLAGNIKFTYLQLSPTNRTITSTTEFARALAICRHNIETLEIKLKLTPENEVMFLWALEQWKDLKKINLHHGELHEEGQVKLQKVMEVIKLEKILFENFGLSD